ncbi:ferredoxin [Kitasatospora sp. NPDC057198]|uniref:ferredoxin n=1 Tax=Kitasatospora sp. NPDC057198 TaxID=3346046 RepID=UPI0036268A93
MHGYWDPLPVARRLVAAVDREVFAGVWAERNWRNVPGPFYGAATDSMATGRLDAPHHIAYDDDFGGGFGTEFVYRQPMDEAETEAVVSAACLELYSGYGWDGDEHWTPATVREWWRDRSRVRGWALAIAADWGAATHPGWGSNGSVKFQGHYHDAARGHLDFAAYIDDGLERYLRNYAFWLDQRRPPRRGEALPML